MATGATLTVLLAAATVLLLRSGTPGCEVAPPRPSLSAQLRALGDFDQAYAAGNAAALQDAAARVAGALHSDLIGSTPEQPVAVAASRPASPDALVVPLRARTTSGGGPPPLAGLVAFLRDCSGDAYFSSVADDTGLPPLQAFPSVTRQSAEAQLGAGVTLEYSDSPLHPFWQGAGPTPSAVGG